MLETIRKAKGLSQEKLSGLVRLHGEGKFTQNDLSMIEEGKVKPSARQKEIFASILGAHPDEIFPG